MKSTKLIIIGGFLGAGKTTLLWKTAQQFMEQGLQVGLITNDQAPELVDSNLLALNKLRVREVSGSCFCCNFNGLTNAIGQLRTETVADVIIAEPVGSCADLSATLIQPLKHFLKREIELSPLTVLADPFRLRSILNGGNAELHPDAAYIFRKQLEESDVILISKSDLVDPEELHTLLQHTAQNYPAASVRAINAFSHPTFQPWLKEITSRKDAGNHLAEMDYDIYANGEAVLGWLNGTILIHGKNADWDQLAHRFLADLANTFDSKGYQVGHVKILLENNQQFLVGNLTGKAHTLSLRGTSGVGNTAKMIINARVEMAPKELDKIIWSTLEPLIRDHYILHRQAWQYLQPGRPQPTHRFTMVIPG